MPLPDPRAWTTAWDMSLCHCMCHWLAQAVVEVTVSSSGTGSWIRQWHRLMLVPKLAVPCVPKLACAKAGLCQS